MAETKDKYTEYDVDGDGVATDHELGINQKIVRLENEDKKQDAQRNMAWFSLSGMLLYPSAVIISSWIGLESAANLLGEMAPTYFVSVAGIVAAFYAKEAFSKNV